MKDYRIVLALLALLTTRSFGTATMPTPVEPAPLRLYADVYSLSFTMVHEFPFVSTNINGTAGKLLFDTGNQDALSLNDHLLTNLGEGAVVGSGFVGSGQTYTVTRRTKIDHVVIGTGKQALQFTDVPNILSQDTRFLEGITPDCLGWLGYDFFQGYLMKLDYARKVLTFYKTTDARRRTKDFLRGEKVIAVLPFETRKLPNHPLLHVKVGDQDILAAFDTGQMGTVTMSKTMQETLASRKLLTMLTEKRCRIDGILLTGDRGESITASVENVPLFDKPGPAAGPMGTPEANILSLGYAFLKQYKTVWDYPDKKIYLLKR
ncbi:MAG: hypothetical protein QM758_05225 [Armatimonas sp.]